MVKELTFKSATWVDDEDGGSVGRFHSILIRLEFQGGKDDPHWGVIIGNGAYASLRGGRDGERTLAEVKAQAEDAAKERITRSYEHALWVVAETEKEHCK